MSNNWHNDYWQTQDIVHHEPPPLPWWVYVWSVIAWLCIGVVAVQVGMAVLVH